MGDVHFEKTKSEETDFEFLRKSMPFGNIVYINKNGHA
ncbi:hypothetical protein BARBAKC583_1218 [Bartonella bacilliformis KC583]|uniref:Uncharacterized protein n=1 Tax=Bartonella bacilliformis (strain ATCC 35685 / KC583 / Herrer 020/F12,63) TaxID=360095 RepID=A1UU17_BARBK|nr:hypothetical protein BARBAKC583_1218 [Bartonella bacilliformis KC583]